MKKLLSLFGLFVFLLSNNLPEVNAQVVVNVRPARPTVVLTKPNKVRANHVWIDGHWNYNQQHGRYSWTKGHWVRARKGHNWVAGRWVNCNGGHKWTTGYWAPVRANQAPRAKVVVVRKKRCRRRR